MSDPGHQPGILRYIHQLKSSLPGIFLFKGGINMFVFNSTLFNTASSAASHIPLGQSRLESKPRNTSVLGGFFPDQERKSPGNPEIPKVFPARKSIISHITGFPAGDGDNSLKFLTVYLGVLCLFHFKGAM